MSWKKWLGDKILQKFGGAVERGLDFVGESMEKEIKDSIKTLDEGPGRRLYYMVNLKKYHWASAPGEPPAKLTGDLKNSIFHRTMRNEVIVGSNSEERYPRDLELGRPGMAPRPYITPVMEKYRLKIPSMLKQFISVELGMSLSKSQVTSNRGPWRLAKEA